MAKQNYITSIDPRLASKINQIDDGASSIYQYIIKYLGHFAPANRALVLKAQHPHPSGALVADRMVADTHGINVHILETHDASVFVIT